MEKEKKILIKNGLVVDVEEKKNPEIKDILIEGKVIKKIGKNIEDNEADVIDAKGNIIMPGFINTHSHIAMTFFRGYAEGYNLMDWLNKKIWPVEDKLTKEDVYNSSKLGILEMIKTGTTTFLDMYFLVDGTIDAINEVGIRACLSRCIMNTESDDDIRIKETYDLLKRFGDGQNELITLMVGPHSEYVCDIPTLKRCVKIAKENNIGLHIHLSETQDEIKTIREKYNKTPVELLEDVGAFSVPLVLAHGVWVNESDIKLLQRIKGGISHNPVSNAKLGSGIAPIKKYIENNITVGIGTDGDCSTSSLDMFLEMKLTGYFQKATLLDSTALDAFEILQMATINGAKILNMENKTGSIKEGKLADLIIIDGKSLNINPINDIYTSLVYSANGNDVLTTIVNGRVIMKDRKFECVNEEEVLEKCGEVASKLLK